MQFFIRILHCFLPSFLSKIARQSDGSCRDLLGVDGVEGSYVFETNSNNSLSPTLTSCRSGHPTWATCNPYFPTWRNSSCINFRNTCDLFPVWQVKFWIWLTMKLFLVLVLLAFFNGYGVSKSFSARPDVVSIGSVLSFDSIIGKVAKVAIEAAVEDVNTNSDVLRGTKLKLTLHDSNFTELLETTRGKFFMTSNATHFCNVNFYNFKSYIHTIW